MMPRLIPPFSEVTASLLVQERVLTAADPQLKERALCRAREVLAEDRPSGVVVRMGGASWSRRGRVLPIAAAVFGVAGLAAAGVQIYLAQANEAADLAVAVPHEPSPPSPPSPSRLVAAPGVDPAPIVTPPNPSPAGDAKADSIPAPSAAARQVSPSSAETYAIELGVLEPARTAVAQGNFGAALTSIGKHQQRFPRGQLSEEREALRVRALWGMGQTERAKGAAAAFRRSYPRSGLLSWLKAPAPAKP